MYIHTMFKLKNLFDFLMLGLFYQKILYPKWKKSQKELILKTTFFIYIVALFWITLMPVFLNLHNIITETYVPMHMVPFEDLLYGRKDALLQVFLNILLFIPLGFFIPLVYQKNFIKTICLSFLMSLSIELLQPLLSSVRASDITDIITNTLGAILGYLLYKLIFKIIISKNPGK